jgi:beta-lactamase class A
MSGSYVNLQRDLTALHAEAGGQFSAAIIDLKSSAAAAVDAATLRPMASVAKWVLAHMAMCHAARQSQSPFLEMPGGETLATLCRKAIATHDRTATARLRAYLPLAEEQRLLRHLGFAEIEPAEQHAQRENRASARALVRLLWHQLRGEPTPVAAEQLLQGMLAQTDPDGIRQGLPCDWETARMTGGTPEWAAEVGVIYLPQGPCAAAVLVEQPYERAVGILSEVGRLIALHLGAAAFG